MPTVLFTSERQTVLAERPEPTVTPGKILVDVDLTGICGSDRHAAGLSVYAPDRILGHEVTDRIRNVGDGVDVTDALANSLATVSGWAMTAYDKIKNFSDQTREDHFLQRQSGT